MHSSAILVSLLASVACAAISGVPQPTSTAISTTTVTIISCDNIVASCLSSALPTIQPAASFIPVSMSDFTSTVVNTPAASSIYSASPSIFSAALLLNSSIAGNSSVIIGTNTTIIVAFNGTIAPTGNFLNVSIPAATSSMAIETDIVTASGEPSIPSIVTSVAVVTGSMTEAVASSTPTPSSSLAGNSASSSKTLSFTAIAVAFIGLSSLLLA